MYEVITFALQELQTDLQEEHKQINFWLSENTK